MTNEEMHDKIPAWLKGHLSETESAEIQTRIDQDPAFAKEVEQERLLLQALDRLGQKSLGQKIARWRDDPDNIPPPPDFDGVPSAPDNASGGTLFLLSTRLRPLRFVPGILILGILSWLIWNYFHPENEVPPSPGTVPQAQNTPQIPLGAPPPDTLPETNEKDQAEKPAPKPFSPSQLARTLHRPAYPKANTTMSPENADSIKRPDNPLRRAQDTLRASHSLAAIALLKSIQPGDSLFGDAQLWLGHAFFKKRQYEDAIAAYSVYKEKTFRKDDADWYLLLAYLAAYPEHKKELDDLMLVIGGDRDHTYFNRVSSIRKQLNMWAGQKNSIR